MKISLLVFDVSDNCLVRVYPIAKVLERFAEVEVIGPAYGDGIFAPYRDKLNFRTLPGRRSHWLLPATQDMLKLSHLADGDVLYAFKPRPTSFGVAILAQLRHRRPILLDIEDSESASLSSWRGVFRGLRRAHDIHSDIFALFFEALSRKAQARTVATSFLQERFGGQLLRHGADSSHFDPRRFDPHACRRELSLPEGKLAVFTGTVRPHKGVEELLSVAIRCKKLRILIVGPRTSTVEDLLSWGGNSIIYRPPCNHADIPRYIAASDFVAIPQRDEPQARAQIPGKMFEAMLMGKPILATDVGDAKEVLGDSGWIVPAGDSIALESAVREILRNPQEARDRGVSARERALKGFCWDSMEIQLKPLLLSLAKSAS